MAKFLSFFVLFIAFTYLATVEVTIGLEHTNNICQNHYPGDCTRDNADPCIPLCKDKTPPGWNLTNYSCYVDPNQTLCLCDYDC